MPRFDAKLLLRYDGLEATEGVPDAEGLSWVEMAVGNTKEGSLLPLKPSLV
jgi:hypothetical protein